MTPKELYEKAKSHGAEDFEIEISVNITKTGDKWPNYLKFQINDIDDVGHSEKAIVLDASELY